MRKLFVYSCFALLMLMVGCAQKTVAINVTVEGKKDSKAKAYLYGGGLLKMWVKLADGVASTKEIRWKTGKGEIALRDSLVENGLVTSDTVFLHWESLPKATMIIDTVKGKTTTSAASGSSASKASSASTATTSTAKDTYDTTYRYLDTIAVVVNGKESDVEVVEIKNILPKIDSVWVGGVSQVGDSTLVFAVHSGERTSITFTFSDAFNKDYGVQTIEWPPGFGTLELNNHTDSSWTWTWNAPNTLIDTVMKLTLYDNGGVGTREYKLQLIVYDEVGSSWVISGSELVKYSGKGSEVARARGPFNEVSDIILNANATVGNKVWVVDIGANSLYQFDTYGRKLWKDSTTFKLPTSLAVDVESRMLWVSSFDSAKGDTLMSRLQRYSLSGGDSVKLVPVGTRFRIPGPIKGLSVDQFSRNIVWFVSPEEDLVGYMRSDGIVPHLFRDSIWKFNRPMAVSWDPVSGLAWIADSSRVIAIDTAGAIMTTITGFSFANSLSSGGAVCWVSDIEAGNVYKFSMSLQGSHNASEGLQVSGFKSPVSVSTNNSDHGVWVADKSAGQVIRLSSDGAQIGSGTGLSLPTLIRTNQVIE